MTRRGEWARIDGRSALRFERDLRFPIDRVWHTVIDPTELAAWFPCRVEGDLDTVGTELRFVFDSGPANDEISTGWVLEVTPPRSFRFTWAEEEIQIALEPLQGGGTRLVFIDLMPDEYEEGAASTASGWHTCLADLAEFLESGTPNASGHVYDATWRALYDSYVADGLPHGAPLPDEAQG